MTLLLGAAVPCSFSWILIILLVRASSSSLISFLSSGLHITSNAFNQSCTCGAPSAPSRFSSFGWIIPIECNRRTIIVIITIMHRLTETRCMPRSFLHSFQCQFSFWLSIVKKRNSFSLYCIDAFENWLIVWILCRITSGAWTANFLHLLKWRQDLSLGVASSFSCTSINFDHTTSSFIATSIQYELWCWIATSWCENDIVSPIVLYSLTTWAMCRSGTPKWSVCPQMHVISPLSLILMILTLSNTGLTEFLMAMLRLVPQRSSQVLGFTWIEMNMSDASFSSFKWESASFWMCWLAMSDECSWVLWNESATCLLFVLALSWSCSVSLFVDSACDIVGSTQFSQYFAAMFVPSWGVLL